MKPATDNSEGTELHHEGSRTLIGLVSGDREDQVREKNTTRMNADTDTPTQMLKDAKHRYAV